jgi:hypothetical protein
MVLSLLLCLSFSLLDFIMSFSLNNLFGTSPSLCISICLSWFSALCAFFRYFPLNCYIFPPPPSLPYMYIFLLPLPLFIFLGVFPFSALPPGNVSSLFVTFSLSVSLSYLPPHNILFLPFCLFLSFLSLPFCVYLPVCHFLSDLLSFVLPPPNILYLPFCLFLSFLSLPFCVYLPVCHFLYHLFSFVSPPPKDFVSTFLLLPFLSVSTFLSLSRCLFSCFHFLISPCPPPLHVSFLLPLSIYLALYPVSFFFLVVSFPPPLPPTLLCPIPHSIVPQEGLYHDCVYETILVLSVLPLPHPGGWREGGWGKNHIPTPGLYPPFFPPLVAVVEVG